MLRRGSFLSWVAVELGIVGFMWVMWLGMFSSSVEILIILFTELHIPATASYTTSMTAGIALNCDSSFITGNYHLHK